MTRRISILVPLTLEGIGTGPLDKLLAAYEAEKAGGTILEVDRIHYGPATIESRYDEQLAAAFSLQAVERALARNVDAILCSCFGDVALAAARELSTVPVVGTGQASMTMATMLGHKFGVITLLDGTNHQIRELVRGYGYEDRCAGLTPVGLSVAELFRAEAGDGQRLREAMLAAGERLTGAGADVILLGCGGMGLAGITDWLSARLGAAVFDPNLVALKVTELLIDAGLSHSKLAYPPPARKIRRLPPDPGV